MKNTGLSFSIFLLVLCSGVVFGQIRDGGDDDSGTDDEEGGPRIGSTMLDDTTKSIYGPGTAHYLYEKQIRQNKIRYSRIDTTVNNLHQWEPLDPHENTYQDLGNMGTAARRLFYQAPDVIGARSGFDVYDPYFLTADDIKYYDTQSPFTDMHIIWGGQNRARTNIDFSRNVALGWNVGFGYQGIFADKQFSRRRRGDRNVEGVSYYFFQRFVSENTRYQMLFNFTRNRHKVLEIGGLDLNPNEVLASSFFDNNAPILFDDVQTVDLRINMHLYHEYRLTNLLQVYHVFDRQRQGATFTDGNISTPTDFYDFIMRDSSATADRPYFRTIQNEVGIKGRYKPFFYSLYYKGRKFFFRNQYLPEFLTDETYTGFEHYFGGTVDFELDSVYQVFGFAETLLNGNYRIGGEVNSPWLEGSIKRQQHDPGIMHQLYAGNHNLWSRDLRPIRTNELYGAVKLKWRRFLFKPLLHIQTVTDYVYFKEQDFVGGLTQVSPFQNSGQARVFSPGLNLDFTFFKNFHFKSKFRYNQVSGPGQEGFPMPEIFANGQLYYENIILQGNFEFQLGTEVHYRSEFFAPAYQAQIMQFYVQDDFLVKGFPVVDVFLNAKINRGRIFLRFSNIMQLITGEGYFMTPFYPGLQSVFDFGAKWAFYD